MYLYTIHIDNQVWCININMDFLGHWTKLAIPFFLLIYSHENQLFLDLKRKKIKQNLGNSIHVTMHFYSFRLINTWYWFDKWKTVCWCKTWISMAKNISNAVKRLYEIILFVWISSCALCLLGLYVYNIFYLECVIT